MRKQASFRYSATKLNCLTVPSLDSPWIFQQQQLCRQVLSIIEQGGGTRLAGQVNHLMLVRKPVEPGGRAFGVGPHVLEEKPVSSFQDTRQHATLADDI